LIQTVTIAGAVEMTYFASSLTAIIMTGLIGSRGIINQAIRASAVAKGAVL
jgi:hypothetical protein